MERWQPPYCGDIGLKIRADGTWLYRDSPILREALVRLFASVLRKDADGRTYLVTPAEKVDVAVEDAPFLAVEMEVQGKGARTGADLAHQRGRRRALRAASIRCDSREQVPGGGLKPYVLVRGRLEALFTRALVYELAALAVEETHEGTHAARRVERRRLLCDGAARRQFQCTLNSEPTRRTSAGVTSLRWATVTLYSLPSSFDVQKSRKPLSLGKRGWRS